MVKPPYQIPSVVKKLPYTPGENLFSLVFFSMDGTLSHRRGNDGKIVSIEAWQRSVGTEKVSVASMNNPHIIFLYR